MVENVLENILENVDEGIFVINHEGKVIYINTVGIRLIGFQKQEAMVNTYEAYKDGRIDIHIFDEVKRTKKKVTCYQMFVQKNSDESKTMLVTQIPVLDKNSNLKYSIGIIRDMDYLHHQEILAKQKKKAKFTIDDVRAEAVNSFIYKSAAMHQLVRKAFQIAESDASVMIQGESGTGKEVMAQFIHNQSLRKEKEMIAVNCAALPENLLEAELFGYEKGAFTGALKDGKPGLVELADGGTLFLDEVDSLPIALQGKLLRVLESREVRRLGGVKTKKINFRLLSATNADLHERIENKQFRIDLFYRMNVISLTIPPLRERKDDIPLLCESFLERYKQKYNRYKTFSARAYQTILAYDWPGNVRELKNFVERIVLITDVTETTIDRISPELLVDDTKIMDVPFASKLPENNSIQKSFEGNYNENKSLKEASKEYEQWLIHRAVETHGSYAKAAKALGIDKSTLIRKLR